VKNVLVFAAPFVGGDLLTPGIIPDLLIAFVAFSLAASGIYLVNDAKDVAADRAHPTKRFRPIAAGVVAPRLAILVAVGNAICGNSAIAAVAPVIGAAKQEVASAIALTAVIGVCLVIGLPLLIPVLGLDHYQYGVLAGMSVYAVPQVVAASFPVSQLAGQVATLVKLIRILLLGPVVVLFAVGARRTGQVTDGRKGWSAYVPWFVIGFAVLAVVRNSGLLPTPVVGMARDTTSALMTVAMAGLGYGVWLGDVRRVGPRVALAVVVSLAFIATATLLQLHLLGVHVLP
jgi:uncharacterized integral membrane protein (TIGR00698 family)